MKSVLVGLLLATSVAAQGADTDAARHTVWFIPGAVGGFSFGAALGYAGTSAVRLFVLGTKRQGDDVYPLRTYQRVSWTGASIGAITGAWVGAKVDAALRNRRPVSSRERRAVRFATVLAGAGIGTAVSYNIIVSKPDDFDWDPVKAAWVCALGPGLGAVGGWVVQRLSPYPTNKARPNTR